MGAAVTQAEDGTAVRHHLAQRIVVLVDVAGQRGEQQRLASTFEEPVEDDRLGRPPLALGRSRRARLGSGLVVGRVAEREDLVPPRDERDGDRVLGGRPLLEQSGPHVRLT